MTIEEMNTGLTKTINNAPTSNTKSAAPADGNGMQQTDAAAVASFAGMLNDMYAAQRKANLDALEAEYTAAIGDLERQKAAIPAQYTKAKNATAGTNALERRSMNEMFTANGLSSGAKAQGNIAQSNALQRDLGELELAEARALADIEGQRSQISAQYQAKVREAIMNNEMQKAAALYDEAIRYDNAMVGAAKEAAAAQKEKAAMLASVGDFSGYSALGYSPEEIAALQAGYQAKQYKGSGGGGPKTVEHPDYYKTLTDLGVTEADDAYQILLGRGLSDAEASKVASGYISGLTPSPAPGTPAPVEAATPAPAPVPTWENPFETTLKSKQSRDLYSMMLANAITDRGALDKIERYQNNNWIDEAEADFLLTKLGF